MTAFAIIPAAGLGRRFGTTKQFQKIRGKPVLWWTLSSFEQSDQIAGVCLLLPEAEIESGRKLVEKSGFKKVSRILAGGEERQYSVQKGFRAIPPCECVVVHDGVRPFVTPEMIGRTLDAAVRYGASVLGTPVTATLKEVSQGFVTRTTDRSKLWNIQTPQAFQYEILKKALEAAEKDRFTGTDEAMLVERLGLPVKVLEGNPYNVKITTPEDLVFFEWVFRDKEMSR